MRPREYVNRDDIVDQLPDREILMFRNAFKTEEAWNARSVLL